VDGTTAEFATSEEARDAYIALVMSELFPGAQIPATDSKTVVVAKKSKAKKAAADVPLPSSPVVVKEKKPKTKKTKTEEVAVPVVVAESPKKTNTEVTVPVVDGSEAESPKEKKKRAPKSEEEKAAAKAKRDAKKTSTSEVDALTAGVAAMAISVEPNLKKMDPTWKKHLKTAAKAKSKEVTKELEAELLGYLNSLSKEEFASKKAEEHVAVFFYPQTASNAAATDDRVSADLDLVDFEGTTYFVNPETKRVYEGVGARDDDTGAYENYKAVGYVGMAAFAEMKLE
jgi:hypothetical protein